MALELNSKIARKIGLRREELPYAHLHEQFGREPSAEHDKAETDIYRPPLSDSDEKSPSLPPTPNPKPESSPPSKRRRRDTRSSQQIDLTNPPSGKKEQHSADIQRTTFTSTNRSSSHHSGNAENKAPPSSSESRAATKNDTDELFPGYAASQGKAPITYQRNIHKSAPSKPGKKQGAKKREKTELPVKLSSDGFKTVDTESICALVLSPEKGHLEADFKQPVGSSPSTRSKRARRRSTNEYSNGLRPARQKVFKRPPQAPSSPKRESPPPPKFKVPKGLSPGSSNRRSNRSNRSSQDASISDARVVPGLADLQGLANQVANQAKIKMEFSAPESSATASSGPTFEFDVGDGNSSSSLSSAPDIEELDAIDYQDEVLKAQHSSSPKSKCPLCKKSVSRLFLEEFSSSGFLNLRQQAKFCKAHNIHSAREVWNERGYPSFEWQELQARLPTYGDDLVGVLNGTRTSFYRNVLDEQVKSGKRTAKQLMMVGADDREGSKMGYYGTKGQRILMDYLMARFASRIRRLAGTDRLVSAAGVAGFVQGVLVPELAVMLVKDDMRVDDEQARVILKESSEIGNLLNEEEDEVIKDEVEEDG
ncbi:MAG: hypothetical protein LQ337_005109 [Flavoplaca oasis]|nr:MAG: hypothetical protein LQ337_005109 [Flavoplaca oasis]